MELLIFLLIVGIAWGACQNQKEAAHIAVRDLQERRELRQYVLEETDRMAEIDRQIAEVRADLVSRGYDITPSIPDTFPSDWTRDRTS